MPKLDWQHVVILFLGGVFTAGLVWVSKGEGNLGMAATAGATVFLSTVLAMFKAPPSRPVPAPPPEIPK